ncbi:MAG TPA: acyl-CoA dehydrogenase family protein [Deltaproteobacteria bacterium]|jgi:alkylation response protein AidB-like acyl-CoA dehydrogenase|nr:acyl-CoA dehydrogenase family protein [Deltaproteobacteria bacterium]
MKTAVAPVGLSEEIKAFRDLAEGFAGKELARNREQNDHYPFGILFTDAIRKASEVGFFHVNIPSESGGIGMGDTALAYILEEISKADASMAGVIFTNAAAVEVINQASLDADCSAVYEKLFAQDAFPLSFHSFTAPSEMELPVVDARGRISGKIMFLTLGEISRYAVIPAKSAGASLSYYFIDLGDAGVAKSNTVYSIGLHACPSLDVTFTQVPAMLIGREGQALKYFLAMQSHLSIGAAAIGLGIMEGSFTDALQYTKDRFQGGRQIIDWPEVRMILANMAIEIEVGRSCLEDACSGQDAGREGWEKRARSAAVHIAEMSRRVTNDGVQLLGGCGYMQDFPQEKRMRDAHQSINFLGMPLVRKMEFINGIIAES